MSYCVPLRTEEATDAAHLAERAAADPDVLQRTCAELVVLRQVAERLRQTPRHRLPKALQDARDRIGQYSRSTRLATSGDDTARSEP